METVKMIHPDLEGQVAEVPTSAVSQHRLSGWKLADDAMSAADVDEELAALEQRQQALLDRKAAAEAEAAEESGDEESAAEVKRPTTGHDKAAWVDYAVSQGADADEAEASTKAELIEAYG